MRRSESRPPAWFHGNRQGWLDCLAHVAADDRTIAEIQQDLRELGAYQIPADWDARVVVPQIRLGIAYNLTMLAVKMRPREDA